MTTIRIHGFGKATPGSNDPTPQSELLYKLYKSTSANVDTLSNILLNGELVTQKQDASEFIVEFDERGYVYFNILVESPHGAAAYDMNSFYIFDPDAFVMLVNTENTGVTNNDQFQLTGAEGTYTAQWDGNEQELTGEQTLTFSSPGQHVIEITGGLQRIQFNGGGDRLKLLKAKNFGAIEWTSMANAFSGCENLVVTALEAPVIGAIPLSSMFLNNNSFASSPALTNMDVSQVTDFASMFDSLYPNDPRTITMDLNWTLSTDFSGSLDRIFADSGFTVASYSRFLIRQANRVFTNLGPYGVTMTNQFRMGYDDTVHSDIAGEFNNAVDALAFLEGGTANWTITEHFLYSKPEPGSNGAITFTGQSTEGFTMNWSEAVDSNYTHAQLTYTAYSSDTGNINSIEDAETNGTEVVSDTGITSYEFTTLSPETGKFVNVIVENPDGVKSIYVMNSEVTNPESDVTPSGTVTDISIAELSQSFEVSFDDTNVTDAFGYDVQFSDVGGANASIHDIGDNTTATVAKSAITSYGETKTLEVRIRAYADEDGAWSSTVNIETNTEGAGTAVIEIETA